MKSEIPTGICNFFIRFPLLSDWSFFGYDTMTGLILQAGRISGPERISDIYYTCETSWHGINYAGWLSYFQEEYTHESPTHRILRPGGTHMILPLLTSDMLSIPLPNIDWAIQIDTTQGGLLLTSQLSIETNQLGL